MSIYPLGVDSVTGQAKLSNDSTQILSGPLSLQIGPVITFTPDQLGDVLFSDGTRALEWNSSQGEFTVGTPAGTEMAYDQGDSSGNGQLKIRDTTNATKVRLSGSGYVEIGDSTSATDLGDFSAGNGVNELFWDASAGTLTYPNASTTGLSATRATIGTTSTTGGLILVDRGGTQIGGLTGPPITLGPVYYDPNNGQLIRFGSSVYIDGDGTNNTINGRDATLPKEQVLGTIGATDATYNLATGGPDLLEFPVVEGTVVIQVVLAASAVFSTVTDDGVGAFPVSAVLPSGGTINYSTGVITGVTATLESTSQVVAYYVVANTAGEALTPRGGNGVGTGVGGDLRLKGGAGGATANGGPILITGGAGGSTSGNAGSITVSGGTPIDGNGGSISFTGSNGVGTARIGGSFSLTAGNATTSATAGSITMTAGRSVTGTAGDISITSGAGGSTSGNSGVISLVTGTPVSGAGGAINITAAAGVGGNNVGGSINLTPGASVGTGAPAGLLLSGRVQGQQGSDVASANDTTLTLGNYFDITGVTQINGIAVSGWRAGSQVTLQFDSAPTIKNNTAASAGFASLILAGATDFVASAEDTLTLIYDGTFWREICRSVN